VTGIEIRRAALDDAGAIGRIYDEAIAGGSATFATGPHHEEERRELGRKARVRVLERFNIDIWSDKMLSVYRDVIERSRSV
jgi:L-amino acid N-acyltransferase YncA